MRVLISPDKFKNSLTAYEVCDAIEKGIRKVQMQAHVTKLPLADGGEGTLEILEKELKAQRVELEVSDPLFRPVKAYYLLNGDKAYIEMAKASGLPLLKTFEKSAMKTSTYGTGELMADAVEKGGKEIYVMIGGSATIVGGCGMADALGVKFFSQTNKELKAIRGGDLGQIARMDMSSLERFQGVRFIVLSDVQNPLTGPNGASHVFGAQKGASESEIIKLDEGLVNLAQLMANGKELKPGAGAAGGLGYGLMSFLNAELKSGIDQVFQILEYDKHLHGVDLVITGEGKLDGQTLSGKVISGVCERVNQNNIPIGIICGTAEEIAKVKAHLGVEKIWQVNQKAHNFKDSMKNAATYVEQLAEELMQSFYK